MAVSSKETINSFNTGLNMDLDDSLTPKTSYKDALNMRVVSSRDSSASSLQPYTGFSKTGEPYTEVGEYTIISTISVRNYIVTFKLSVVEPGGAEFFTGFKIDRFNTITNITTSLLDESITHIYTSSSKFSCVSRYEDDDNIKVYWADGVNPIRSINVADGKEGEVLAYNRSITNVEYFNIKPLLNISKPRFKEFGTGSLLSGKIQYAYSFYNKNGQQTETSVPSDLITLTTVSDTNANYFNIKGDTFEHNTGKSCIIEFDTPIGLYQRVKIIAIHYLDNTSAPTIKLIGDIKLEDLDVTTFIDFGTTTLQTYTVDEFNLVSGINFSAKYIESKNNYLFAGNITNIDFDVDYDARAYRANLIGYSRLMSSSGDHKEFILQDVSDGSYSGYDIPLTHDCINSYNDLNKDYTYFDPYTRFYINYTGAGGGEYSTGLQSNSFPVCDDTDKYAFINEIDATTHQIKRIKLGGIGPNIKYEFIWTEIELDEANNPEVWTDFNQMSRSAALRKADDSLINITKKQFEGVWHIDQDNSAIHSKNIDGGVPLNEKFCDYSNSYIDLKYKSLHRDELYRYGIVFYNKYGIKSTVKWIGDIRTPHKLDRLINTSGSANPNLFGFVQPFGNNESISFKADGTSIETGLKARPLGIRFTIGNVSNLITKGVVSYEIVRVKRTLNDKSILSQGYVSKLFSVTDANRACPSIYPMFTKEPIVYMVNKLTAGLGDKLPRIYTSKSIKDVIQFVSPDTTYNNDTFYDAVSNLNIYTSIIGLYGSIININSTNTIGTTQISYQNSNNLSFSSINKGSLNGGITYNYSSGIDSYKVYRDYKDALTYLQSSIYYTDLYYTYEEGMSLQLGKNTDIVTKVVNSVNFNWNENLADPTKMKPTDIGGVVVYNYNLDSTEIGDNYGTDIAGQGPSSPSLFILENKNDINKLSDSTSFINGMNPDTNKVSFYTQRQSLVTRGTSIIIGTIYDSLDVKPLASYFNNFNMYHTNYFGHSSTFDMVMVNLKHKVNPYNGNVYQNRQYSIYTSIGYIHNITQDSIKPKYYKTNTSVIDTFNGDTYLCIFDNQRNHSTYQTTIGGYEQFRRKSVNFKIPLETSLNLTLTSGPEIHRNNSTEIQILPSDIPVQGTCVPLGYVQTEPLYQYNSAYSAISDVVIDTVRNELDESNKKLDTRIVYSEQKINDELQDSWTIFKAANFLEVDNRYGAITNLKLFRNELLSFQENAISKLAVKERSLLQDNNIGGLVLGTGEILERYDYLTTNYGIAPDQSKSIIDTENALYWFDHYRNQILHYNGQVGLLSKVKSIQSYLNKNKSIINPYPVSVYNRELNDVMFNLFTDNTRPTLAFNEQIDAFSSFYSIDYIDGCNVNGKLYLLKDNSTVDTNGYDIIKYTDVKTVNGTDVSTVNDFVDNLVHNSSITYVVNDDNDAVKIFDNVEFNGLYPFTSTAISYKTDGKQSYTIDSSDIENRELTYKYAIPRIVSGEDIPDRVRGHVTECTFTITPSGKLFRIPYFKTRYRTSKS